MFMFYIPTLVLLRLTSAAGGSVEQVEIRAAVNQSYLLILGATLPAQIVHRSRGWLAKLVFKHQRHMYASRERLPPVAEGENLETKIKESLSQGHLPSICLAASLSLQLHEQPAISQGSEMGGPKLNSLSVAAVAVCITGLVHYLSRARRAALKRRSDGCAMRSRQISSSLAVRNRKLRKEVRLLLLVDPEQRRHLSAAW